MKSQFLIGAGILALLCGLLLASPLPAFADTCTWDGSNGKWSNARKWSCGRAPGILDTAVINRGTVTLSETEIVDTLNLRGGEVNGEGMLSIKAGLIWTGGTMAGTGFTTIDKTAIALLKGRDKFLAREFYNNGTVNWTQGDVHLNKVGEFINLRDGLFDVQGRVTLWSESKWGFKNYGILRKSADSTFFIDAPFHNYNKVEVLVGQIIFDHGGSLENDSFTIAAGSGVWFEKGEYEVRQTTFTGEGEVAVFEDAKLVMRGLGDRTFSPKIDNLVLSGGTVAGDDVYILKRLDWRSGTMAGLGTTYAEGTTTFRGAETKTLKRQFHNQGTAKWSSGDIELAKGAVFLNYLSGAFDIRADRYLTAEKGAQFNNGGIVRKSAGSGTATIGASFSNYGTVESKSGTLAFSSDYSQTGGEMIMNKGDLRFLHPMRLLSGKLSGVGEIWGSVHNSGGTVSPGSSAGKMHILGDYTQGAYGKLNIEIGGGRPGADYDRIVTDGKATLGGTLSLTNIGDYRPYIGDTFKIIKISGARAGTFATVEDNNGAGYYQVKYGKKNVTLVVPWETTRVSVASDGTQANQDSWDPSLSADGRYVVFTSLAKTLASGVPLGSNVFVHDRTMDETTLVPAPQIGGYTTNADNPSLSADGRYVVFHADAAENTADAIFDIFVHDRVTGQSRAISRTSDNRPGRALYAFISADGRYVAFAANASLTPDDTDEDTDLYLYDQVAQQLTMVTRPADQALAIDPGISLSADGRYIAFLGADPRTNGSVQVFVWDRTSAQTTLVSVSTGGAVADQPSFTPAISSDGRYVVFASEASNLASGDNGGVSDIFRHDRQTGQTIMVSVKPAGATAWGDSFSPSLSGDGRHVAFIQGAEGSWDDVFVRDLETGITRRVSIARNGGQSNGDSADPSISSDGRYAAFISSATNLVAGDTNGYQDVFVTALR